MIRIRRNNIFIKLALVQWKLNLFNPLQQPEPRLVKAILRLIESHRNGEAIDQGLLKKVLESFVSLGLDETDINSTCLDVYKESFMFTFLRETQRYYVKESEAFLAQNTISEYLRRAEERLKEEADRVDRYLNSITRHPLIRECEKVLIDDHAPLLWESFQRLLDDDKDDDLQRMYVLLSRMQDGLEPLRKRFEEHVKRSGLEAVSKLAAAEGGLDSIDPKVYIDTLSLVHQKEWGTVSRSFHGESGFVASLDKACRDFVNRNPATGTSSSKSPELLAKYVDLLLRKNNKMMEENDVESALNRAVTSHQIKCPQL